MTIMTEDDTFDALKKPTPSTMCEKYNDWWQHNWHVMPINPLREKFFNEHGWGYTEWYKEYVTQGKS